MLGSGWKPASDATLRMRPLPRAAIGFTKRLVSACRAGTGARGAAFPWRVSERVRQGGRALARRLGAPSDTKGVLERLLLCHTLRLTGGLRLPSEPLGYADLMPIGIDRTSL